MCKGNVSLRCEKYYRILLGEMGPVEAEIMAFKVLRAVLQSKPPQNPAKPGQPAWEP